MIASLRTYFVRPGNQPVDAVIFALGVLGERKRAVVEQLQRTGFAAAPAMATLEIALGDPNVPTGEPLTAYVNAGNWLVRCECGGIEMVDLECLVTMCCACWNRAHGHGWRSVFMTPDRETIEAVLLKRPDPATRNWHQGESIADLEAENVQHGVTA